MTLPVVSLAQMAFADSNSALSEDVLIQNAGKGLGEFALGTLHEIEGSSVAVIVGPGNNGADGRVAAEFLRTNGIEVDEILVAEVGETLNEYDLVVDAAYGTGFRGEFFAPDTGDAVVISVDIPSGLNGDTGHGHGSPFLATKTLTFGAIKSGLLFGEGPEYTGEMSCLDIGIEVTEKLAELITLDDVLDFLPYRSRTANKWSAAVCVVAGSPGMFGAADLTTNAAYRAGAGMVRLCVPGVDAVYSTVIEAVSTAMPNYLISDILDQTQRCHAVAIGPGLGRIDLAQSLVRDLLEKCPLPIVVDGDGLYALGTRDDARRLLEKRVAPTILTPHDGEFARLAGAPPSVNRIDDVKTLARELKSFVLLKGPTTIIAAPYGDVYLTNAGDQRLATAGAGDVLTGIIAALLAQGVAPFEATTAGSFIHGHASSFGHRRGLVAHDLPELLPLWFEEYC